MASSTHHLTKPPAPGASDEAPDEIVEKVLELARARTGMDLTWVSSFRDGQQVFEGFSGDAAAFGLSRHVPAPLDDSYCARVLDGRLDNVVANARTDNETRTLPFTRAHDVGSYIGVPIPGEGREPQGMLCGVSRSSDLSNGAPEVRFLERLAGVLAEEMSDRVTQPDRQRRIRDRVGRVLRGGHLRAVLQPIVSLQTARIVGVEALARFPAEPLRPDIWFAEAESVGLGLALELAAVKAALAHLPDLPDDVYLSINASPALICGPDLLTTLATVPGQRIVVELTEHVAVNDYGELEAALERIRATGARLAIDDVGAGFSSFNHVLRLRPDIVKLDISITRDLHLDPARRGLARGLLSVAHDTGATVVAEGVESQGELDALLNLGVDAAQGFFLARPGPLPLPTDMPRPTPRLLDSDQDFGNESDALTFLARTWFNSNDLESVTRPLLDAVLDRTGLETSYLTIKDTDTGALEHRYVRNAGSIELPEGFVVPWDDTLCKRCRDAGINWTADVPADLPGCDAATALEVQTFLSVPLRTKDGDEVGTLCAASTEARFIGETTIAEIELMARLIADRFPNT